MISAKTKQEFLNGEMILIDKPLEWTSFQVVNKVRWLLRKQFNLRRIKVGHAGTLDPLATGLLILCVGKFTKKIEQYQAQDKEYTGTILLGATTPSYDAETEVDKTFPTDHIDEALIDEAVQKFIGTIQQKPPIFSALKRDGKRLYEYARKGEEVDIPTREIRIESFEITRFALPEIDFRVVCSKGTYIRSLAHDFGKAVQSGGYLTALRRTKIGSFDVENSQSLEEIEAYIKSLEQ
ncbi:MAG TPA: tRNA pseudouridine(55) synthase TruB [Candidatus Sphingobacterium stercoripullorum]|nr:tRNA pseudouridine(55) synthase TruB [Candidatus Sphingobacterium stercoripullorum]